MSEQTIKCRIVDEEKIKCNLAENKISVRVTGSTIADNISELLDNFLLIEDFSLELDGIKTEFTTLNNFYAVSLKVFINGLWERGITITGDNSFEVTPPVEAGESLVVEYIKKI